ncbi:2-amino-4,5-dihydroxy-6-one-heptanoic acid-7-phosphate synthase [Blastococcus sp. KM273128]|nr:2-amino-4,5-dihydroxy-6-one-heptanoic acid-7-phosphate synthase [Blastococcus sp. KM273128]
MLVVPLDHSVTDGPIRASAGDVRHLVTQLSLSGVDAIVLHKGALRAVDPSSFTDTALIVHLSASTAHAADPDAKYLVATVAEALRLGADAVSVHVNLGSRDEARQVGDMATVAEACDRWNLPLLAMMYPRGPRITDPRSPELIAHAAVLAADLGADLVKTPYAGSPEAMRDVVRASPIPVLVAGGAPVGGTAELMAYVDEVLESGAGGLAMGRNVFQARDPGDVARQIAERAHTTADLVPLFHDSTLDLSRPPALAG